ncbi:hypothetical protein HY256_09650 [Candidatus Sumerlaeota bacterium]|nr:hypothetical protein [Candidatus Sumerlaeota bacterium]
MLLGTPAYMAPELNVGHPASELSDQFSIGRTILHMFEKRKPRIPPPSLKELRPDLPVELSNAIDRCMQIDPSRRFSSLKESRDAIVGACDLVRPE